jgi:hypothetical protein
VTDDDAEREEQVAPNLEELVAAYDGDDLELRKMIEARGAISELMQHPGWVHLRDYVYSIINKRSETIVLGTIPTFEQYKWEAGWCKGALIPFEAIDKIEALLEVRLTGEGADQLSDYGADRGGEYDPGFPADQP